MADTQSTYSKETLIARVSSLIDDLRSQCALLDRLSVEQGASVRNGEIEAVLDVLARRECVLRDLGNASDQIMMILGRSDYTQILGPVRVAQAHRELKELEGVADAIRERDAEHHELMEKQRVGLAEQLGSMGQQKTAISAYSGYTRTPNPTIQDRRG